MNNWFAVNPVFPWWVVVALLLPLFVFCVYKEFKRNQKFLGARLLALTLLLVAVLGIFLRPMLLSTERTRSILLTEGYEKQKVDSIIQSNPSVRVFTTTGATPYPGATRIGLNEEGAIHNLSAVLGNGLSPDALQLLPNSGFKFIPPRKPQGITRMDVPTVVRPQVLTTIHGLANVEGGTSIKLVGPSGPEDSVITNSRSADFTLKFRPRQAGLFLYSLLVKSNSRTQTGTIPIEVSAENKLRVLFLQKFPTAEIRALKNYLTEKGHAVALRYQVSKSNFNYEYSNLEARSLARITPELLSSFDLLFLDNYVFEEIGTSEKTAIQQSVRDGLGVILFVDKISGKNKTINNLLPIEATDTAIDTVHVSLQRVRQYPLPAIPIVIKSTQELQPVLETEDRILSGYLYSGFGKIGFQLLRETYRLSLEGNADDYAFVWRDLIERTARMKNPRFKILMKESFPHTVSESVNVEVLSDGTQPDLIADRAFIPVEEDVLLDDAWHAPFWPQTPGWHSFTIKNDSTTANYFVNDTSEWKTLRQIRQRDATQLFSDGAPAPEATITQPRSIDALYWYGLFLISAGFLWLAPKL